jgi:hypothetical protein
VPITAANGDPPLLLPFLLVGAALLANAGPALASTRATAGRAQYTRLVWSDEFTGSAGTAPNVRKWVHDVGTFGWTDNELQTYTASPANASLDGRGDLATVVRRQTATGPDGLTRNYTSAKLETQGLFSARYGTFVARMQLPAGSGLWPAFWMVGDDFATVGWPASGEIERDGGGRPEPVRGLRHRPRTEPELLDRLRARPHIHIDDAAHRRIPRLRHHLEPDVDQLDGRRPRLRDDHDRQPPGRVGGGRSPSRSI